MGMFQKATKKKAKLRLNFTSASGGGKTTSALLVATAIAKRVDSRIALIDSERGSASLYSDDFEFDVVEMENSFSPEDYIAAMHAAEEEGFKVIILDGISPEWNGPGGCLEIHNKLGGKFTDWARVTPRHNAFIQAILTSPAHVLVTCRSKTDYQMDVNTKKVSKQGLKPEQRDGLDYEMTVVFDMNQNHVASVSKDRTHLFDGKDFIVTEDTGNQLMEWLDTCVTEEPIDAEIKQMFSTLGLGWKQQSAAKKKYSDKKELLEAMKAKVKADGQ